MSKFWTVGKIAAEAGAPVHCVEYFIKSRAVKPCGRAGAMRVFAEADALFVVAALRQRAALMRPEGERRA